MELEYKQIYLWLFCFTCCYFVQLWSLFTCYARISFRYIVFKRIDCYRMKIFSKKMRDTHERCRLVSSSYIFVINKHLFFIISLIYLSVHHFFLFFMLGSYFITNVICMENISCIIISIDIIIILNIVRKKHYEYDPCEFSKFTRILGEKCICFTLSLQYCF